MGYATREKKYTKAKGIGTPQMRRLSSGSCARGQASAQETASKGESLCSRKRKRK